MSDDVSDAAKLQKELLWGLYSDVRSHARHAELLRSNALNYVFVAAFALMTFVVSDGHVRRTEMPMCIMIALLGTFGLAFIASYTELYQRNRRRATALRNVLDDRFFAGDVMTMTSVLDASDQEHRMTRLYRWTRGMTGSAHRFWLLPPCLLAGAGVVLTLMSL